MFTTGTVKTAVCTFSTPSFCESLRVWGRLKQLLSVIYLHKKQLLELGWKSGNQDLLNDLSVILLLCSKSAASGGF